MLDSYPDKQYSVSPKSGSRSDSILEGVTTGIYPCCFLFPINLKNDLIYTKYRRGSKGYGFMND
jgi:hypothetical protein